MSGRTLSLNALTSAARILASAGITVLLYRFLLARLGDEQLGLWAVVLATAGAGNIGAGGVGSGLLRFAGSAAVQEGRAGVASLLHTALLSVAGILLVALPVLAWVGPDIVRMLVPAHLQGIPGRLFPAALTGLACAGIAGVYQAALEGLQRYDRTNIVLVAGAVVHAAAAVLFVPGFGVVGLGWAYAVQWAFVLAGMIIAAGTGPGRLPVLPRTWSIAALRRLLGFGWKMQAMGLIAGVADPVTKWTVTLVAGVGPTAYLDMGMRLLGIVRQVLVGAAATLVPAVATLAEAAPERLAAAYARARDLMAALAPPLLLLPAALAPLVPALWIGRSEPRLDMTILLCAPAFCVNALSAPPYFFLTATGRMNFPLSGHIITLFLVPSAGLLLGTVFGFTGAAAGAAIAMIAGSAMAFAGIRMSLPLQPVRRSGQTAAALLYAAMIAAGVTLLPLAARATGAVPAAILGVLCFAAGTAVALRWSDGWRPIREITSMLLRNSRQEST